MLKMRFLLLDYSDFLEKEGVIFKKKTPTNTDFELRSKLGLHAMGPTGRCACCRQKIFMLLHQS